MRKNVEDAKILDLWWRAYPPSAIDRVLGIDYAKDVIVRHWAEDDIQRYARGFGDWGDVWLRS